MSDPNFSPFNGVPPPPGQINTSPAFSTIQAGDPGFATTTENEPQACTSYSTLPSHPGTADQVGAQSYNFQPGFASSTGPARTSVSNNAYPALIDPALLPQPLDEDHPDPATIARSRGLKPATKVGGARQKDKGKKRARSSDSEVDSDTAPPPTKQRGRPKGSSNFVSRDVNKLLDIAEKFARKYHRPERDEKSLESKYKLLLKAKKPTGDAACPPEVKRAHRIEHLINTRAGTRELSDNDDDSDSDSDSDASSDGSIEVLECPAAKVHTAVARRTPTPPTHRSRMNAPELVTKLAKTFDPDTQQSQEEERSQRSFQTTQLFTLTQQLRDAQTANDGLRNELASMRRACDHAELKLEMYEHGFAGGDVAKPKPRRSSRSRYIAENYPDLVRRGGKIRCEQIYPDGGACTQWVTDGESSNESEKENWDPNTSSLPSFHRSSSPFDRYTSSLSAGPSQPRQQIDDGRHSPTTLGTELPVASLSTAGAVFRQMSPNI
ncbi:hypothetical protein DFH08DRAFT_958811 [Mycena albidolilacea]|uniref:DUF6818 domain-containing protein n=1 Tax=Mycena albidolilacea TaxID=1033008 RepID=A0AAD7A5D1_9AGAR|nr:hypothetical protein DFH08DRAFT_958811 [Mycena albidolilacea]